MKVFIMRSFSIKEEYEFEAKIKQDFFSSMIFFFYGKSVFPHIHVKIIKK